MIPRFYLLQVDMSFNIVIWNARGVANVNTQSFIKRLVKDNNIIILAIIEPLTKPKPDFFSRIFGLQFRGLTAMAKSGCLLWMD